MANDHIREATKKIRLIDANVVRQKINAFAASVVYRGSDLMITGKDSCNPYEYTRGYEQGVLDAQKIVNGQETVDAMEVVHGRWMKLGKHDWCCSACKIGVPYSYTGHNYCPNCGAKMDGGKDDGLL